MINGAMRPWGKLDWLFRMPTVRGHRWFLIGAVSTQDRCQSVLLHNQKSLDLGGGGLLRVIDEPSAYTAATSIRLQSIEQSINKILPGNFEVLEQRLLGPLIPLRKRVADWIVRSEGNVVLDISALPERFSFPILRWLVESPDVRNLALTYMLAEAYTKEDLGYDAQDWGQLPTFVDESASGPMDVQHVVVGVGFLPYSLSDWLKKTYSRPSFKVSLLLPFPAPPSSVNRAWDFIRKIEPDLSLRDDRQIIRVGADDLSAAYQRIETLTRNGRDRAVFAPYGPKAHSIAMALHALKHKCEVYFTQPSYYHPEYSMGIAVAAGLPAGHAYAVRLNGVTLY
jgi:hypothetical protein